VAFVSCVAMNRSNASSANCPRVGMFAVRPSTRARISLMYASLAKKAAAGQKEIPNQGTATDINIVSTLLPYCDAMFVDNKCRALLRDIPKTHALPYPCRVFSPKTGADFIHYLTEIRDSAAPDHLRLVEQVYGPDPLKPPTSIYGVGQRHSSGS